MTMTIYLEVFLSEGDPWQKKIKLLHYFKTIYFCQIPFAIIRITNSWGRNFFERNFFENSNFQIFTIFVHSSKFQDLTISFGRKNNLFVSQHFEIAFKLLIFHVFEIFNSSKSEFFFVNLDSLGAPVKIHI